jgi:hypothetical protein
MQVNRRFGPLSRRNVAAKDDPWRANVALVISNGPIRHWGSADNVHHEDEGLHLSILDRQKSIILKVVSIVAVSWPF